MEERPSILKISAKNQIITQMDKLFKKIFTFDLTTNDTISSSYPLIFKRTKRVIPVLQILVYSSNLNENLLITSLMYADRWTEKMNCFITQHNIYNLFLASILVSIKMYEDSQRQYCQLARLFDTDLEFLFELEQEFLQQIEYDLYISEDDFRNYSARLKSLN